MRCDAPTLVLHRLRLATRSPGRVLITRISSHIFFYQFDENPGGNSHAAVEVHSVNPNTRVILDSQIDVFANTEAKVARLGEVSLLQFVFLNLEATLEDFFGLGAADGDVDGDLFVTADTECADGVAGFACGGQGVGLVDWWRKLWGPRRRGCCGREERTVDGGLTAQLLEHFGGLGQSVTGFADGDVKDEFLDAQLAHGV